MDSINPTIYFANRINNFVERGETDRLGFESCARLFLRYFPDAEQELVYMIDRIETEETNYKFNSSRSFPPGWQHPERWKVGKYKGRLRHIRRTKKYLDQNFPDIDPTS